MGPIMLTITYFYDSISMDVDNLPKPISPVTIHYCAIIPVLQQFCLSDADAMH
jgi:hypothetical protein